MSKRKALPPGMSRIVKRKIDGKPRTVRVTKDANGKERVEILNKKQIQKLRKTVELGEKFSDELKTSKDYNKEKVAEDVIKESLKEGSKEKGVRGTIVEGSKAGLKSVPVLGTASKLGKEATGVSVTDTMVEQSIPAILTRKDLSVGQKAKRTGAFYLTGGTLGPIYYQKKDQKAKKVK